MQAKSPVVAKVILLLTWKRLGFVLSKCGDIFHSHSERFLVFAGNPCEGGTCRQKENFERNLGQIGNDWWWSPLLPLWDSWQHQGQCQSFYWMESRWNTGRCWLAAPRSCQAHGWPASLTSCWQLVTPLSEHRQWRPRSGTLDPSTRPSTGYCWILWMEVWSWRSLVSWKENCATCIFPPVFAAEK